MKTSPMLLVVIGSLLCGSALAQNPSAAPDWQSMKIIQTDQPGFPNHLLEVGVKEGAANVVISTDANGNLVKWLVVGYTQPEFADTAVAALKRWKFIPARLQGEPVGTTVQLAFHFRVEGLVVTSPTSLFDPIEARIIRMRGDGYAFEPCPARELDRVPTPVVVVRPAYPKALAEQGIKGAVQIEYYIDQDGAVRMPVVSADENNVLSALAIDAVKQWKFTPPTSRGSPVLVRVTQEFRFKDGG